MSNTQPAVVPVDETVGIGSKLLLASGEHGKLTSAAVRALIDKRNDIHYPKPQVLSLTQSTELGTVYSPDELTDLSQTAKTRGLRVHMDGARFANAVATLSCPPAEITWRAGVDVLCLGGTKNGMSGGDAVVFFDRALSSEFAYRCKQAGQLASKMRFLSAQWVGLLQEDAWLRHAANANRMAQQLCQRLCSIPAVRVVYPVQSNAVFAELPSRTAEHLRQAGWPLYTFIGDSTRFVCSWDTTRDDIDRLISTIHAAPPARG